jgi:2-keto-4-pentenoate hydratase/2-oxohepta-3-ene-1,7-dioic acid hydratase in catechol pathway
MKLMRFGEPGHEKPAVELDDGTRLDVSDHIPDFGPDFFACGGMAHLKSVATAKNCPPVKAGLRIGSPVARPHSFIAIGLNYRKHAEETGATIPKEPEVFVKLTSCICGPNDEILQPRKSEKLDYEVELAFVMKNRVHYLGSAAESKQHIAGFLICNDVSERGFQRSGSQWTKGKGCQSFGPLGPWLLPTEIVGDYGNLQVTLKVNGQSRQDSNTNDLIFNVDHIVWYLSQHFILEPGDIITTGTPNGVALGMKPPGWLVPGDKVETSIAKLGTQSNVVRAAK